MHVIRRLGRILSAPPDAPELILAQWRAMSRQVPLLYAMLLSNTLLVAGTHFTVAPIELTLYVPIILAITCIVRVAFWARHRNRAATFEEAKRALRAMVWVGAALAIGFVSWSLSLFPYGDAYLQAQIGFYLGITCLGCMLCLMHVKAAALTVGIFVLVPFTIFFSASGQVAFVGIAINLAVVIAVLIIILLANNRDFAALVASRNEMAHRQSETQRLLDENHRLANMDSLTGLPNRRSFGRHLTETLRRAEETGTSIAVARLDLDRFKSVNDIFGQNAGDRVIIAVARRIEALHRNGTLVARLAGNSFALIMEGELDEKALAHFGDVLCQAMRTSFDLPGGIIRLSASAGFATSVPGDTADSLYDRADYATSVAKRDARGTAVVFSESHASEIKQVRRMEHLLHTANLSEEIYILLQPQFDVALGATTGFEVLARWRSPILGEVSPAEFIPMAERTGQINKITQIVLRQAMEASVHLPRPIRLSVNLSAHDIGSATAIDAIASQLGTSEAPCRIDFEITETAVMRDLRQANQSLLTLLGLGARIALDDFGTGHSSLTHVQKLPLHRIKVDRSFVVEVINDPASRAIIKTMIDLGRNLGISCVFEGIETEEQLDALMGLGGTVMQGYLFGRPMTAERISDYLSAEETRRRSVKRSRMLGAVG